MDISSLSSSPTRVTLPDRPFSPWLRLAHMSTSSAENATQRARVRELLDFELVLQLDGAGWIWVDEPAGSVEIRPGQLAFFPPGFRHGWANAPGSHLAVHFDFHAQPELEHPAHIRYYDQSHTRAPLDVRPVFELAREKDTQECWRIPMVTDVRDPRTWRERLEPLCTLYSLRAHKTLAAQARVAEALGWAWRTLVEDAASSATEGARGAAADPRILALLRDLDRPNGPFQARRPSVEELAERTELGQTAFRAAFLEATGRSPRTYLEERRIERAARMLLETERSIYAIGRAEGYDDPYHFSRAFKRVLGTSPRQYRRRAQTVAR
ncbi:MAG: helix-turn-helix domain-containing protein [Planctomycetes bacterium]|nr:helix-turn-helix domain-containing protein [Planctomycetota bacterium]